MSVGRGTGAELLPAILRCGRMCASKRTNGLDRTEDGRAEDCWGSRMRSYELFSKPSEVPMNEDEKREMMNLLREIRDMLGLIVNVVAARKM